MLAYFLYLAFGTMTFRLVNAHKWTIAQSAYYAMTIGLSIGYGAMQPASESCKMFAILYVVLGACALTLMLSVFVRKLVNLLPRIAAEEWRHQARLRQSTSLLTLGFVAPRYRVDLTLWLMLFCWAVLGVCWAHEWQPLLAPAEKKKWTWLTCMFFATGTITTAGALGPELDEDGNVPSESAAFLAVYSMIGVPLFGAAVSHAASSYVEAQVRRQERERIGNRLSPSEFAAVRELRYGAAAARRSMRSTNGRKTNELGRSWAPSSATAEVMPNHLCGRSSTDRNPCGERVLWGDFLALQLLRLRKVDFELLKDLREEYLEMASKNQETGGLSWSLLTPLLADAASGSGNTEPSSSIAHAVG
jgi:hypothetical protein